MAGIEKASRRPLDDQIGESMIIVNQTRQRGRSYRQVV